MTVEEWQGTEDKPTKEHKIAQALAQLKIMLENNESLAKLVDSHIPNTETGKAWKYKQKPSVKNAGECST